jgi:hypothetical protein
VHPGVSELGSRHHGRLATTGLQLVTAMMKRIWVIRRRKRSAFAFRAGDGAYKFLRPGGFEVGAEPLRRLGEPLPEGDVLEKERERERKGSGSPGTTMHTERSETQHATKRQRERLQSVSEGTQRLETTFICRFVH